MTGIRVLIVEDEGVTALAESDVMRELGYKVIGIVMTGEGAVQAAARDKPDVVLMDIMLADKMTGDEAARQIWQSQNIPVVYVTAIGDKAKFMAGKYPLPEGVGYIVKPFTKEELKSEIERLVK